MRIPIGISNRHVHLSPADVEKVFGKGYQLTKFKDITQPGQFACNETVTLLGPKGKMEHVRVVGPTRKESQIEIMLGDNFVLGTNAPVRVSGEFSDGENISLLGPAGECFVSKGMIASQRHLHCTIAEAEDMGLKNGDMIKIKIPGPRGLIFEQVAVRARDDYALDFHIDIEEANAAGVKPGDWGEIVG
ncbi:MAG: phosphate propanoyltransferase [candidate division SR1 bacterium]|nr:phosphate propanoyltransferase [candidate division SR1 bacterium]